MTALQNSSRASSEQRTHSDPSEMQVMAWLASGHWFAQLDPAQFPPNDVAASRLSATPMCASFFNMMPKV